MHEGICCTYYQLKLQLLISQPLNNKNRRATQKSIPFRKRRVREKDQENEPKAEMDKTERATTRQMNKRGYIEKWDQTDSPEFPDRGET